MDIFAHRGASSDAPENTLPAIELAWQQGADAVEVDVHITSDDQTVVIHDSTTAHTAGTDRIVAESTLAELRALDVGTWKDPRWAGTRIPTLAEVVSTIPPGKRLVIELKFPPQRATPFVHLCRSFPTENLILIGFSLELMREMRAALPACEVGWVSDFALHPDTGLSEPDIDELIRQAAEAGLHSLDLDARGPIDATLVGTIHRAGLRAYVWTVDSIDRARQLQAAGIDAITTNTPAAMIAAFRP